MIKKLSIAVIILLLCTKLYAADIYVRDGGSATGSDGRGGDWDTANCYDQLTSAEAVAVRGDVVYVADGTYNAVTFNVAESSTTRIYIKKATASDHGIETGWLSAYGDGQSTISAPVQFDTGYWTIDGQARNESDWFSGSAYGFQIANGGNYQDIVIHASNITVQYVYVNAIVGVPEYDAGAYAIDTDGEACTPTYTGLIFSRMFVNGGCNVWFLRSTNGAIVEYSASSNASSNAANHGEIVNLYFCADNAIVRYNKFKDAFIGSAGTALVAITDGGDGLQYYGNVAWNFETGDAAIGFDGNASNNNLIYNNTFADLGWGNAGLRFGTGTGNVAYNNIWTDCSTVAFTAVTQSHNDTAFSSTGYVDYANADFRLATATTAGTTLSSPYDVDMLGTTRGSDGTWDRGAYEFVDGEPTPTPTPTTQSAGGTGGWR